MQAVGKYISTGYLDPSLRLLDPHNRIPPKPNPSPRKPQILIGASGLGLYRMGDYRNHSSGHFFMPVARVPEGEDLPGVTQSLETWRFPKIWVPFLGVPVIRTIVYWGPPILGIDSIL